MSSVLRFSCEKLEAALQRISLAPYRVDAGVAYFDVSDADLNDLAGQITDAIAFLQAHREDITLLMSASGGRGTLDFAVEWRDVAVQYDSFPAELVREAGGLGLALELSHYPVSEEPDAET